VSFRPSDSVSSSSAPTKTVDHIRGNSKRLSLQSPRGHIDARGRWLDCVIFNFLVGNGDAHGKNFSVLYRNGAPRLAPAYDILCTAVYPSIAKKMAMKFDGKFEFRWITSGKIVRTFARAGVSEKLVRDSIVRQIAALRTNLPALVDEANSQHPSPIYHDIIKGIHQRIRQLNR